MSKDQIPAEPARPGGNSSTFQENGREYGRQYEYLFPCDQLEMDKLSILHNTVLLATENKAYTAPVYLRKANESNGTHTNGSPPRAGRQVLDLGTGTGMWATKMAEEHPDIQVFAVDLFDFQHPRQIWQNTWFSGHMDVEKPWDWLPGFLRFATNNRLGDGFEDMRLSPDKWDLIYARMLNGSIKDRPQLYRRMFEHLTPGFGYIELVEIDWTPRSDDNTLPENSYFVKWANELYKAMDKAGRDIRIDPNMCDILRQQGFVDVQEKTVKLHYNPWITGGREEELGRWFNLALTHGLQGMSMAPFTRYLHWSPDEVNTFVDRVRHEICLLRHHGYCTLHIWTAGRPAN